MFTLSEVKCNEYGPADIQLRTNTHTALQRLILLLLLLPCLFSCDKDESNIDFFEPDGEFTFRGKSCPVNSIIATETSDGSGPALWGLFMSGSLANEGMQLSLRNVDGDNITSGNYTYCSNCLDSESLIDGGLIVALDSSFISGILVDGTVIVEQRNNEAYRIIFDLMYSMSDNSTPDRVIGQYDGPVTIL